MKNLYKCLEVQAKRLFNRKSTGPQTIVNTFQLILMKPRRIPGDYSSLHAVNAHSKQCVTKSDTS